MLQVAEKKSREITEVMQVLYPTSQWKIDPSKLPLTKYSSWKGCHANAGRLRKIKYKVSMYFKESATCKLAYA